MRSLSLSLCRQGLCCIPDEMSELSLRAFHCVRVCVNTHSKAGSVFTPVPRSVCMHIRALVLSGGVNEPVARVHVCVRGAWVCASEMRAVQGHTPLTAWEQHPPILSLPLSFVYFLTMGCTQTHILLSEFLMIMRDSMRYRD